MNLRTCFEIENAFHISHHGTILSDAYIYGLKVIGTHVSPLSCLDDKENCLFVTPKTNIEEFYKICRRKNRKKWR